MNKDRIQIIFANKMNHKIVCLQHETYANRRFTENKLDETFWIQLSKDEIDNLIKNLSAAAGI